MAISAAMQQISGGIGAALAGFIVTVNVDQTLSHFNVIGYIVAVSALITLIMLTKLARGLPAFQNARKPI
jgi:hypothetical protein